MTVGITELPPEGMQLGGVALAGDAERGTKTTEGLSLLFTAAGITVQGPQPQIERLLVWSGLDSASCSEKIVLPDGRDAAVMELTSGGQSIRFLLPTATVSPGQAAYLDQALPAWLARYKGPAASSVATAGASTAGSPSAREAREDREGAPSSAASAGAASSSPPPPPPPASAQGAGTHTAHSTSAAAGSVAAVGASSFARVKGSANGSAPGLAARGAGSGDVGDRTPTTPPFGAVPPPPPSPDAAAGGGPAPAFVGPPAAPPPPREAAATPGSAPPAPGAQAPPPPPGTPDGTTGWELSTDAMPAATAWDDPPLGHEPAPVVDSPPKRTRGWRKARPPADAPIPPPGALAPSEPPAEPPIDPVPLKATLPLPPPETPVDEPAPGAPAAPADAAAPAAFAWKPPIDPATGQAQWDDSKADAPDQPTATAPKGTSASKEKPTSKSSRSARTALLILVVVALIGGIAYFATKKNNNSTTTTTTPSPTLAGAALAASVNLRLGDLPAGWVPTTSPAQVSVLPLTSVAVQVAAGRSLAACLGSSAPAISELFGAAGISGLISVVPSATFQSGSDPNIQMASVTTALRTPAQVDALAVPFANPNFTACFGQYHNTIAAAAVPGSTAQVQQVDLPVPTGVKSFGYVTTITLPAKGTEVLGEAFIFGGRVMTRLEPTTNGPPIPSSAFVPAYNAIVGRVAASVGK